MKIKINEFESYEFKWNTNSEINLQEFQELLQRMNQVNRMFSKDSILANLGGESKEDKKSHLVKGKNVFKKYARNPFMQDKEKVLQTLKIYFSDDPIEKRKKDIEALNIGMSYADLGHRAWGLSRKFKFKK